MTEEQYQAELEKINEDVRKALVVIADEIAPAEQLSALQAVQETAQRKYAALNYRRKSSGL